MVFFMTTLSTLHSNQPKMIKEFDAQARQKEKCLFLKLSFTQTLLDMNQTLNDVFRKCGNTFTNTPSSDLLVS